MTGCADILYTPANSDLNDPDVSGCDRQALDDNLVKSCRRLTPGSFVQVTAPFFDVVRRSTIADPYKLEEKPPAVSQFFFELTPLGIVAPIFNYPPRDAIYTGRVELSIFPPGAAERGLSKFEFRVKAGETFTKTLEFNKPPLKGSDSVEYSPDSILINIRCRAHGCTLTSASPAVNSDGSIRLQRL